MDQAVAAWEVHPEQLMLGDMLREVKRTVNRIYSSVLDQLDLADVRINDSDGVVRDVIFRHSIPLAFAGECFEISEEAVVLVGTGVMLAYSLPLTVVDRVLDRQPQVGSGFDSQMALINLTHAGYLALGKLDNVAPLCDLISSASLSTMSAMRDDALSRYPDVSSSTNERIDWHWNSKRSRLNASNVNRIMLSVCSILRSGFESPDVRRVGETIGRFRQVADELLDLVEDSRDGLITLPTLLALATPGTRAEVLTAIESIRTMGAGEDAAQELRRLVLASDACARIQERVTPEYRQAGRLCMTLPKPEFALALLIQRRLQIDRAIQQGLTDANGGLSVDELLVAKGPQTWREIADVESRRLGLDPLEYFGSHPSSSLTKD